MGLITVSYLCYCPTEATAEAQLIGKPRLKRVEPRKGECANCTPRVDGGTVCVAYLVIVVIGTVGFVVGFCVGKLS